MLVLYLNKLNSSFIKSWILKSSLWISAINFEPFLFSHIRNILPVPDPLPTIVLWLCVHDFNIKTFPFSLNKHTILSGWSFVVDECLHCLWFVSRRIYPSKCLLPPIMFTINSSHLTRQSIKCVKWVFMYGWMNCGERMINNFYLLVQFRCKFPFKRYWTIKLQIDD